MLKLRKAESHLNGGGVYRPEAYAYLEHSFSEQVLNEVKLLTCMRGISSSNLGLKTL